MAKRALIIGSQTGRLGGVHNDVAAISKRLLRRDFELDVRIAERACAEGIREGLRKLICDSRSGDLALIYFSGHGTRVVNPRFVAGEAGSARLLQCLVPTDWSRSHFRGLVSQELSLFLAELTEQTRNTTVVLDCCYSARMWRDASAAAIPRSFAQPAQIQDVERYLAELCARDHSSLSPESNPHALRFVATEADRCAYEMRMALDGQTQPMGVMTATLCELLDELGDMVVSWRTLALLVRERVMYRLELQCPEYAGPGQRLALEYGSTSHPNGVSYFDDEGEPSLRTNRLLGAEIGGRYALLAKGEQEPREDTIVAEATITAFSGSCARVRLEPRPGMAKLALGASAVMLESPLPLRGVRLRGSQAQLQQLRSSIASSLFVREVEAGALVEVESADAGMQLRATSGEALSFPIRNMSHVMRALERWARADLLRCLGSGGLEARYALSWGRVASGECEPMSSGDTLHVNENLYVRFENRADQPLFVTVFDIGIDATLTLLTRAAPRGRKVEAGGSYTLGLELRGTGMPLSWPREHVPEGQPLRESLVVIVTQEWHDFAVLETGVRSSAIPDSSLARLLGHIARAGTRSSQPQKEGETHAAYVIEHIDFSLSPLAPSEVA